MRRIVVFDEDQDLGPLQRISSCSSRGNLNGLSRLKILYKKEITKYKNELTLENA